ncbi:uncharacterized protein LOC110978241 [Acanthaster planci]|uniref:Uncharacterized protein LOC110978241 n=1 Tax=Acanthaster planci TaxID=133434 RepID=A0A8B7YAM3_ACAPL|nr:uncharacterized protein LOC110978241 [Acanthaster planci]
MASTEECVDLQGSEDVEGSVDRCGTGTIQHSASNLATKQLLEDRAAQYCSCDVVGKGSFPGGRGGRDMARDTRGRMEQEKLLMQSESREVEDGTSTCRGRMGSGQVEEREDSSTESRETVNETQPYHVHIVKHCPNGDPALTFVPEPEANSKGHFIRLPVIVSKYWGPDQYQADNPGRCLVKAIVALGTLLLVAVICFLAGYFTVKFPNEESTISSWKGPVRVKVETSLRQHYVTAYNDRNSPQYRDFSRNFSKAVDDVFMDSSLQNEFSHCTVDRLRRGSVLVEFTIHLHGPPTSSNTELNPSGDAELTTRQAVMEVLRDAVASGQLDTLNVDGESIRVTRVLIGVSYGSISSPPTPELTSLLKREPGLVNQLGCGTRLGDTSRLSRILGGTDAMPGRWPWLGSIQYQFGDELAHRCAASLLNPEWAITAAHCVDGGVGDILVHIVFGDNDLGGSSPSRQTVHVERIMVHPGFSISWHDNDLALLKLRQRVRFDENVSPACVETEPYEVERYQECYIAGWGHTQENGNISRILQEVEIPLVGKSLCSDQFRSPTLVAHRVITDNMICAGKATGGVDSCQSDSGGPLMCLGDDGSWRIVGLTSFGYGCGRPDYSGVYTRVSRYWDYLTSVVRGEPSITCEELTDPICRSRLPYTTVFPSSQEDLSLSTILNNTSGHAQPASQMVMSSSSRELMETLLCLTLFGSCESSGELPLVPCRQFCQSAMNIHFSIVARCDKYPDGPARDTMFCRKGINADCGPTHLYPTTTNHSNIISPYYPAALFNYRTVGCTWLVTGPSCTAVIFKFTELKLLLADRGKIITIGSGNDPQNRSSGLYKFFGLSVPSPRVVHSNLAWMSFSSVSDLFDDPQEAFQFSVEVHVAEVRQQDVTDDVCLLGLGDCTENELCFPSWWRCDGITDCSGGEDEADCAASTKQVNTTETTITP